MVSSPDTILSLKIFHFCFIFYGQSFLYWILSLFYVIFANTYLLYYSEIYFFCLFSSYTVRRYVGGIFYPQNKYLGDNRIYVHFVLILRYIRHFCSSNEGYTVLSTLLKKYTASVRVQFQLVRCHSCTEGCTDLAARHLKYAIGTWSIEQFHL
jgi:hypothetical protein